ASPADVIGVDAAPGSVYQLLIASAASVGERLVPVECHLTCGHVEMGLRVAGGVRERDLDTTELVHQGLESGEVDLDVVMDGDIEGVPHGPDHQRCPSIGVSGVDLVLAVTLDGNQGVTGNAQDQ